MGYKSKYFQRQTQQAASPSAGQGYQFQSEYFGGPGNDFRKEPLTIYEEAAQELKDRLERTEYHDNQQRASDRARNRELAEEQKQWYEKYSNLDVDTATASQRAAEARQKSTRDEIYRLTQQANLYFSNNMEKERAEILKQLEYLEGLDAENSASLQQLRQDIATAKRLQGQQKYAQVQEEANASAAKPGAAVSWSMEDIDKQIRELDNQLQILTASNMNEEADALKVELDNLYKLRSMSKYAQDEERTTYSYLKARDAETGGSEAREYLDFMQDTMNYRKGMEQVSDIRSIDNDVLRTLAIGAHSVGTGMANAGAGYNQLLSKDTVPTTAMQYASQELMDGMGAVGQTLYSAGTTVGNMLPSILLSIGLGAAGVSGAVASGAASAAMGASVAGNTYTQAVKEGYDPDKAKTYAALVGASEGVLQYVLGGIGKLGGVTDDVILAKVKTIDNALARMALTGAVKIGSEITEEELQLFLEPAIKSIVFDEGYDAPKWEEIIETAVVTALSTGALESASIIGAGFDNSQVRSAAADLLTEKAKPTETAKAEEPAKAPEAAQEAQKTQPGNVTAPKANVAQAEAPAAVAAETVQQETVQRAQAQTVMNRAAQAFGETGQKAFQTLNDSSTDPLDLYAGFAVYHQAGMTGRDINSVTSQYANNFPENYRQIAYDAGVADAAASVKARTEAAATATVYGEEAGVIANDYSKSMNQDVVRQLDGVAKSIGRKIVVEDLGDSNGYLDSNGVIHLDIHAENPHLVVAAHEITHVMEDMAPAEHKRYRDYVLNKLAEANGGSILELVEAQKEAYAGKQALSDEQAMNELVADYTKRMMQDKNLFSDFAKQDQKAAHKLLDAIKRFLQKVRAVFNGNRQAQNAAAQREFGMDISMVEEAAKLWQEALTATQEASKSTGVNSYADVTGVNKDGVVMNADGTPVAAVYDNGSTRLSLKTYKEGGRSFYEEYLEKQVKNKNLTAAEAADMLQQLDAIYDICNGYRNKYAPFSAWSDAAVQVDSKGNPVFSVIKKNGEYSMNLDFSLVCKKRRTLDGVFNLMVKNGMIDKIAMGEADIVKINDIIRSHGFETACALCFVDAKRFRQANVALQFAEVYNDMVKSMIPEGSNLKVGYHNFGGNTYLPNVTGGIDTMADSALDMTHINEVLAGAPKKKANWTVEHKVAEYLKRNPADRKLVDVGDFMSTAGFEQAQKTKPGIMGLYNAKKGSGGPKAAFGDVQYLNDILKRSTTFNAKKAYAIGGVRVQSFSGYVPRMVFDYVQMISELAAKKLPAHAYTKEPLFAMQYGMTGMKINLSLIPKVVDGGIAPGLDANGNYVWADESFPYDVAVQIQDAKGYSANCGTICVGVSDEHIRTLMADDSIRMVIPYHKSGLNHIVASMNKIDQFEDYTNVQNTRYADSGTKLSKADAKKETGYNERLRELGDPRKAAEAYVRWCEENNYLPKFDKFAYMQIDGEYVVDDEGKRVVDENYYKLLEDFTGYDNGTYAPQGAVTMTFPQEGDAFGSMADLIAQGLEEDAVLEADRTEKLPKILDDIATAFGIPGEDGARHSVKGGSVVDTAAARAEDVEALKSQLAHWKSQVKLTKGFKVDSKAVESLAKKLIRTYQADTDAKALTQKLQELYDGIATGYYGNKEIDYETAKARSEEIAKTIVENAVETENEMYVEYAELRKYLRSTTLNISAEDSHDIPDFNDFRKRNFGRMRIGTNGTNIDTVYKELSTLWPEFFNEEQETTPSDQLLQIADVLEGVYRTQEVNPFGRYEEEAVSDIADEVMANFFTLPQAQTFADKAAAKLKQATADAKLAGQMGQGRRDAALLRRSEERAARAQERAKAALAQEKQRGAAAVKNLKDKQAAKTAKTREQRKAAELRGKIIRHSMELGRKLERPTDKKHVPDELQSAVAAVLNAINLESNRDSEDHVTKRTKAFQQLREAYKKLAGEVVIDPAVISGDGDQAAAGPLLQAVLDMGDIRIADMNSAQLDTVWRVLKAVEQSVSKANKLFLSAKYETISDMASQLESHSVFRKPKKAIKAPKFLGGSGNLTLDLEIPLTFFSQYGDVGEAIYQELRDAQDYQERLTDQLADEVGEIVKPKQVQQLQKEVHTLHTEEGVELKLTTAHIMELYELAKRKQAEDHLLKGGIVQPEIESAKVDRGTDMIKLTANDLGEIISKLTPEQKQIADSLQKLLTTTLADAGNRASMQAYGYKKFTGTDYWPIKSAQEALHSKVEKNANNTRSIKNIGLAQQVVPHANTALNLNGIFQTFAGHATDMIDYASWLCPMEDANRLFNYKYKDAMGIPTGKTVKGLLDRVGGSGSQAYWSNLMEDIQNGIGGPGDSAFAGIAARITGNVKGASVGANIRVVAQQPTAIFRAATVLSPANLSKGLAKGVTKGNGWQKALEHSDIAKRKDRGGFEISNPMQMSEILYDDKSGLARFNDAMSWAAAKADSVTWGKIWNACEWQVHSQNKALTPGSEAFYQQTAKLFADVINQSQVVDGVMQRSQIMRSSNQISKQMTSFMGEPTMSLNMLMRAYDAIRYEKDPPKRGKAMKQAARVAGALLVTDVMTALAQSLIDGLRDDDRDKGYWQRFWSALTGVTGEEESAWDKAVGVVLSGNLVSTMNPIGRLPYAKDLLSLIQGYSVERMDISAFSDLIEAGTTFVDSVNGEGTKTWAYATKQLATAGSKVLGISAANILRDVWSIARSIAIETGNIPLQYEMEKAIYKIGNEKNDNRYIDILYDAMNSDEAAYRKIYADMIRNGMSVEKISKGIEKRMKEDQGVTSVTDLTSRYLTPDQETVYDKAFDRVAGTKVWKSATEEQRGKLEGNLYDLTVGNDAGGDLREKIESGKSVGIDEVDYVLYKLAQEVASKDGNNNTSQAEAEAAAKMLTDLSRAERAWLWQSTNKRWKTESNPFK